MNLRPLKIALMISLFTWNCEGELGMEDAEVQEPIEDSGGAQPEADAAPETDAAPQAPEDPLDCHQVDYGAGLQWEGPVSCELIGPEAAPMTGITEAHNAVRRFLGLPELSWSEELAQGAQEWSDHLSQICNLSHTPREQLGMLGENLAMGGGSGGYLMSAVEAVGGWSCEREDWDNEALTCNGEPGYGTFPRLCGHYTQLVWRDTREVGCGFADCEMQGIPIRIWTCRYDPGGNMMNPDGSLNPPY